MSQIKVGKKTPVTLAYFGFDKQGGIIDDADIPRTLTSDWLEQEGSQANFFPSVARLLAKRGTPEADSDFSWTVDFAARRAKAQADMQPFLEEVKKLTEALLPLKEDLKVLKKDKADKDKISAIVEAIKVKEKDVHEAQIKAADIDAAVYDLKAVNPNVKAMVDTRTVLEIIDNINVQGQIVAKAMDNLWGLMTEK